MRKVLTAAAVALAAAVAIPSLSSAKDAPANLARTASATASSAENAGTGAAYAVDGDLATRWSSMFIDPQTIELDLGAPAAISEITLHWEAAYGKAYTLAVSDDRSSWTTVKTVTDGDGGTDDFGDLGATGRYVRLTGTARATQYGYSLYEFEVFGEFTQTAASFGDTSYQLPEKDGTLAVPVR